MFPAATSVPSISYSKRESEQGLIADELTKRRSQRANCSVSHQLLGCQLFFGSAADGHCGDCQSSIRIEYAHCEEGKFRIIVRTADGMTQKLRLDGEPVMHLARTSPTSITLTDRRQLHFPIVDLTSFTSS